MSGFQQLHGWFCDGKFKPLLWPPDVFGFTAQFARATGIYRLYATNATLVGDIGARAKVDGARWKRGLNRKRKFIPKEIEDAWKLVCKCAGNDVGALVVNYRFCEAMLYLLACADEACVGIGLPNQPGVGAFEVSAEIRLSMFGNLCQHLPPDVLRVLPKLHTPRSGLNIRSLSHHLSLTGASEVKAEWTQTRLSGIAGHAGASRRLKILLAPWPLQIASNAFSVAVTKSKNDDTFGYFNYVPNGNADAPDVVEWLKSRMTEATNTGHPPDIVIFPECALDQVQWRRAAKHCSSLGVILVAGVHQQPEKSARALNSVKMSLPLALGELTQYKHHRWMIDADQIRAYSLRDSLSEKKLWWENIQVRERKLHFVCMNQDFTFCALVCEDLARQDPASELVRAVGPNLVVALLSDGPQIDGRWPSRYASVLADDPGCSVLTISSLGMVERSRPSGKPVNRTVASWKDAFGSYVPLDLGVSDDCLLIDVIVRLGSEWTIDGRSDDGNATYPVLVGLHGFGGRK